jgi:D-amino peptidase
MAQTVKIFISFDMEGVTIVSSWRELKKDAPSLNEIRTCATEEVSAAVRGARRASRGRCDIVVCDAHAEGENLIIDKLPKGIHIVKGSPREFYMVESIDNSFDLLFCIGYHAMAGTLRAGMDHTYSSSILYSVKINGVFVGETEINAGLAGHYGVPLGLVTGDDQLINEVHSFFGDDLETVITKQGISRFSMMCRHPADVQDEIETKAARVVKTMRRFKPFTFAEPLNAEFDVTNSVIGDLVEPIPGIKRVAARTLSVNAATILDFYRTMRLVCSVPVPRT